MIIVKLAPRIQIVIFGPFFQVIFPKPCGEIMKLGKVRNDHYLDICILGNEYTSFKFFIGPFLSILHQNKARVGGWDFNSTQIYFLSNHSICHYNYVCSTKFCMIRNGLSCQEGTCVLNIVVRFVTMFPCNQIKSSQNPRCEA